MSWAIARVRLAVSLGLLVTIACGPRKSDEDASTGTVETSTTGSTETTSGETTGQPPQGCVCTSPDDYADLSCSDTKVADCGAPEICPYVGYTCPRENTDYYSCHTEYVYDEEALRCALEALRDRSVGVITGGGETDLCGIEGCGYSGFKISILGDGKATYQRCGAEPMSSKTASASVVTLAPPDFYASCLELPSPADRYDCLLEGLDDYQPICD